MASESKEETGLGRANNGRCSKLLPEDTFLLFHDITVSVHERVQQGQIPWGTEEITLSEPSSDSGDDKGIGQILIAGLFLHVGIIAGFVLAMVGAVSLPTGSPRPLLKKVFLHRHLIAHRSGIVDQKYLDDAGDSAAIVGRRMDVDRNMVEDVINYLDEMAAGLVGQIDRPS